MLSRRRFDVDEYYRMAEAGILHEDDGVELIDGEIVRMTAIGSRHASCVIGLNRSPVGAVGDSALVSVQNPVRLGPYSEPQPDLLLLRPRADAYAESHPGPDDVLLLIEVADTSLPFDRDVKLPLYGDAGVPEVWIIDLGSDRIEIHRRPKGKAYSEVEAVTEGTIRPVEMPGLELDPSEALPPRPD